MARSIPPSLAALVEHLELERNPTVTLEEISGIAEEQGLKTPGRIVAHRLARLGWLLPTPVRGTWEFAPAERAGAIPDADPLLPLRALLSASAKISPRPLALGSALWIQDLAERSPDRREVAVPYGIPIPPALRREYRVLRHTAHLDPAHVGDLPVHRPATVLVHWPLAPRTSGAGRVCWTVSRPWSNSRATRRSRRSYGAGRSPSMYVWLTLRAESNPNCLLGWRLNQQGRCGSVRDGRCDGTIRPGTSPTRCCPTILRRSGGNRDRR